MANDKIIKALIRLFGGKDADYIPGKAGDIEGQTALSWIQFLRTGLDPYNSFAQISQDRIIKYNEYDLCDQYSDIACVTGDSKVFTLAGGWQRVDELAKDGKSFWTLSYDSKKRALVPALASKAVVSAPSGHTKPMVRVELDNGVEIRCTADHPFLLKDETWVEAGKLKSGARLMAGDTRLSQISPKSALYWQVRQPHVDSALKGTKREQWILLHDLVARCFLDWGGRAGRKEVVHHKNFDSLNNEPDNLEVLSNVEHGIRHHHIVEWNDALREAKAKLMRGNTYRRGTTASMETRQKMSVAHAGKKQTSGWIEKRTAPRRRVFSRSQVTKAFLESDGVINQTAKLLGTGWTQAKQAVEKYELSGGGNHRVVRVTPINTQEAVYDIEVPKYHNFLCNGVIVHNTALDIYSEESSQPDPRTGYVIWVESKKDDIKKVANTFLRHIRAEDRVWAIARNIAKYGDTFEYLLTNQFGIYGLQFIHPSRVSRVETDHLLGFQCDDLARLIFKSATGGPEGRWFLPWDFIHFRIESFDRETIYGRSMIENVRKTWKELQILETMVAVFRITKGVERNIFYVDVGQATPQEAKALIDKWRQHLRKQEFIDPVTKEFKIDMKAVTPQEDFIIPTRKDSATKIEKLAASPDIGALEDLKYFRSKLRTALGIPKSYFDQDLESTGWNSKEALIMQDARFSRKISRLRRSIISGYTRMVAIHLTLTKTGWSPGDFEVKMAPINQITVRLKEEWWLRRVDLLNGILPLAQIAGFDQKEWNDFVLKELLPMPDDVRERLTSPSTEPANPDDPDSDQPKKTQKAPMAPRLGGKTIGKFKSFDNASSEDDEDASQLLGDEHLIFSDADLATVRHRMTQVLDEIVPPPFRDAVLAEVIVDRQENEFLSEEMEELHKTLTEEFNKNIGEAWAPKNEQLAGKYQPEKPNELLERDFFVELTISDPEKKVHEDIVRRATQKPQGDED